MKKATVLLLILSLVFVFVSCRATENEETTLSEETILTEENAFQTTESEETSETVSETVGSVETSTLEEQSTSEVSDTVTEKIESETTEIFTNETPAEETTVNEDPVTVTDNKIIAPDYSLEIPEDFEVKTDGNAPLLENKQGTIQFNIMDKTKVVKDFDAYVSDTYKVAEASGIAESSIEEITLKNIPMKRFSMAMTNDEGEALDSYVYFLSINNKVLMVTLTSKDGGLDDVASADKFVEEIDFQNY